MNLKKQMNLKMTRLRLGTPRGQFRLGTPRSRWLCQAAAAGSLVLLAALVPGTGAVADDKKADPSVIPATKCRILSVGDHWLYDLNYRSVHPVTPPTQDSAIAALLGLNGSDNFRAKLDIRVTPYPKAEGASADAETSTDTEAPAGSDTPADTGTAADNKNPADASAPDNSTSSSDNSQNPDITPMNPKAGSEAGDNDVELAAEARQAKAQAAAQAAAATDITPSLSLLINLQYKKDGQDHTDYAVYYFSQSKSTGKLSLMLSTDPEQRGALVPGSWGLGSQFETFFPVGSIWYLQPLTSLATIIGTEKVKVKAGEFAAWKVSQKEPEARYNEPELSNYWWYDPTIVFPVKAETSYANGAKAFITLTSFEPTHK